MLNTRVEWYSDFWKRCSILFSLSGIFLRVWVQFQKIGKFGRARARRKRGKVFIFKPWTLNECFFSQTLRIASYYFKAHKNTGKSTKIHSFKALALDGSTNIFSCLIATMRYKMDGVCCTLYRIHDHGDMTPTDTHRWRRYLKHTKRDSQSVQMPRLKGQCDEIFLPRQA